MPHRLIGIVAPLLLLALSACSDQPKPKTAPEPEPTTSAGPATPSRSPELADPVAVIEAWVDARNQALADGDLDAVRSLTAARCKTCDGVLDPITRVYESGGRFDTPGWSVESAKTRSSSAGTAVVDAAVVIRGGRTVASAGAEPVTYEAEKSMIVFRLRDDGEGLRVSFIGFLS